MDLKEFEKIREKEGDEYEFEAFGLPCFIWRNPQLGSWCGYVGVSKESKLYKKEYDYFDYEDKTLDNIKVHGGITFSEFIHKKNNDIWYFGFDCAHCDDWSLLLGHTKMLLVDENAIYRDKEYVIGECKKLAEQLKNLDK